MKNEKIIIGEDKIKSKKIFFFSKLIKIPIKLNIPENWIKFPNCSAQKKILRNKASHLSLLINLKLSREVVIFQFQIYILHPISGSQENQHDLPTKIY